MNSPADEAPSSAQAAKEERAKSQVEFTYNPLDDSEDVVGVIRSLGGTGCSVQGLAGKLEQSATGGAFRMKMYSARSFGLLQITRDRLDLTELGLRIIDPKHVKAARVEAFLRVPLFRLMFDQLHGQQMPPAAAVERMMVQAGVPPKQKERARQVFMRSAKGAGFFDINSERLIKPEVGEGAATRTPEKHQETAQKPNVTNDAFNRVSPRVGGGGGGEPPPPGIHRFELPIPGKPSVQVLVPDTMDADDWDMLSQMFGIYVNRWKGYQQPKKEPQS